MTQFQDRLPNDHASLIRRIEQLERDAQQARAARRLEAATIGRGGITIQGGALILKDTAGNEIARMGIRDDIPAEPDGDPQPGFILRRNDGSIAFTLDDPNPAEAGYKQLLKMQDAQGNIIFSEDYLGGWGLATPTLPLVMYAAQPNSWANTNSSTYITLWQGYAHAWNPRVWFGALGTTSSSGTTGNFRLTLNGTQYGDVQAVDFNGYYEKNWDVDLVATNTGLKPGGTVFLTLEAQRTAGTGTVQITPEYALGQGSPSV